MKEKISFVTKGGPGNERRTTLRAELDELRSQQSGNKASRGKIFDEIKTLQEGIQKKVSAFVLAPLVLLLHRLFKVKDLQSARGKTQFRTVEEVDAHIRHDYSECLFLRDVS